MSRIRSKWTSPEKKIHDYLKGNRILHKMHPKIAGNPDIILLNSKTAIFIQGCFWHKCPRCYKEPKSRKSYWLPKIQKNVSRDKSVLKKLQLQGFKVIRIWEHELKKDFAKVIKRLINFSQSCPC